MPNKNYFSYELIQKFIDKDPIVHHTFIDEDDFVAWVEQESSNLTLHYKYHTRPILIGSDDIDFSTESAFYDLNTQRNRKIFTYLLKEGLLNQCTLILNNIPLYITRQLHSLYACELGERRRIGREL